MLTQINICRHDIVLKEQEQQRIAASKPKAAPTAAAAAAGAAASDADVKSVFGARLSEIKAVNADTDIPQILVETTDYIRRAGGKQLI